MLMYCQDDEISSTTEMVQKLQEQMADQEESIAAAQRERDQAQAESQRQQSLSEASMNEVKEVLQALEELALSYEQKTQEVLSRDRDNEALTEELTRKQVRLTLALTKQSMFKQEAITHRGRQSGQPMGDFTFWISLSLSPKLGLSES